MLEKKVENWDKGLIDSIEDYSIPENAASRSLNWLTRGDKIELAGGYDVIGTEIAGSGKITGLACPERVTGVTQPVSSYGTVLQYYDNSTEDWVEIGSDQLGTAASGEDVSMTEYTSLSGYQLWISSPNSSLYKLMLANPGSIVDQYNASKNFKGYIKAANNRLFLWYRDKFRNILYLSSKDTQDGYTTVSAEAIGALGSANYAGTLAFKAGGATRTCFNVVFTDGTLTAQDDKDGNFTGDATGTINYATGAYDITFSGNTTGAVTADYEWEDSTADGIADFNFSSPRVATEGSILPQSTGGDLLNVMPYKEQFYCLHKTNGWIFSISLDDLTATNQEWRDKIGMMNHRAAVATGDGIYYIDTSNQSEPRFKKLTLETANSEVVPQVTSFNVDLTGYDFSEGVAFEWGEYLLYGCKITGETKNNRTFVYSTKWKSFDVLDYGFNCLADNGGLLWAGDSQTNNVLQLFSGFSANGSLIENYWEGALTRLGVDELKKFRILTVEGEIQPAQSMKVYLAYDRGAFTEVGTVSGDGDYVDLGVAVTVGGPTVGSREIGGGSSDVIAYHYKAEFKILSQKFDQVKIKFVAQDVGYVSVSNAEYYDIKKYGQKNILRYRTT